MAETRYCILETQGQMCVSVSGYIFLLLLLQWNQNTFLHVSNRFAFQESLFPKSLTCVYVAEMQNSVPETCYFIPSSAGEFNATVDVTLRSTGQHPIG